MKKTITLLAILIIVMSTRLSFAQGISLYGSFGYGLGRGGNEWCSSSSFDDDWELKSIENHYLSIGKGIKLEGGFQVNLNENFGLRFGGGYSKLFPALEEEDKYQDQKYPDTDKRNASLFQLQCIGVLKYTKAKIHPYAGFGGGLFFANMSREGTMYLWGDEKYTDKVEYRFKPTLGFIGIFGFETSINTNLSFFAELNLQQVAFTIKEWEVVEAKEDGQDVLDEVDVDFEFSSHSHPYDNTRRPHPWHHLSALP